VPEHFREYQNSSDVSKSVLTAKFTFGNVKTPLETSKLLWKPQNICGTVPALFTPL
jgi:hypothetical protein